MRVLLTGVLGLCVGFALQGCGEPAPAPTPAPTPAPEVTIKVIDDNQQVIDASAAVTKVAPPSFFTSHISAIAPIWISSTKRWIYSEASSVRGGFTYQYDPMSGETTLWRHPNGQTIGLALDAAGTTLYMAEEDGRKISKTSTLATGQTGVTDFVTMTDDNGTMTNLISPFDIIVNSAGMMYISDDNPVTGFGHLIRVDTTDGTASGVTQNDVSLIDTAGIALTNDETKIYVVDQGVGHQFICGYAIDAATSDISGGCTSFKAQGGTGALLFPGISGIKVDDSDNLWIAYDNGVDVYTKDGNKLLEIEVAGGVANLAFGGEDGNTVMLAANAEVYTLPTKVKAGVKMMRSEVHVSV